MRVLLVDWLGRGGIAQTSMSWRRALRAAGAVCTVVTRPGRELAADVAPRTTPAVPGASRLIAHQRVAQAAAQAVRSLRPDLVVVQNYVVPALEWPVYRAAHDTGAGVVTVVHDHRLHSRVAGAQGGLRRELRASDRVLAHSAYVADRLDARAPAAVIPHPVAHDMLETPGEALWAKGDAPLAVHFGVLKRGYKGTPLILRLAATTDTLPWHFGVMGVGAPPARPRVRSSSGYVPTGALVATVGAADAVVLPYRFATQSGAVVLAQALGVACVVSGVGGIVEQVQHGVTGLLVPAGDALAPWAGALADLHGDQAGRRQIGAAARRTAYARDREFAAAVSALVTGR
ncbi:glycosyltransferase [soil metagenome]